jgi:hypothetical protein
MKNPKTVDTSKVYGFDEYIKLRLQNRLPPFADQYQVRFCRTLEEPVEPLETATYVAEGKDRHEDVKKRWEEDFPGCTFYRVSYC